VVSEDDLLFVRGTEGGTGFEGAAGLVGGVVRREIKAYRTIRREDIR
jgi:hypothetical protein